MTTTFRNFIAGEFVPSASGATFEVRNPADTDEVLGLAPASTVRDVADAVAAAADAFPKWAGLPAPERGRVLHRAANDYGDAERKLQRTTIKTFRSN